jgi:ABC-type antimicrobial peptide transport system permease subunit
MVRMASGDPAGLTAAIRREVRASDANVPLFSLNTMEAVREKSFWEFRFFGSMFSVFGGIALLLASVGVYGVISYSVQQRTQEIGVRMALGARGGEILGMVIRQGVTLTGLGVLIGLVGAFGVTRVVGSMLHVSPTDPLSFVGIALFLTAVAVVASWMPARRAMGVDPIVALRD